MKTSAEMILYRNSARIFEQLGFLLPRSTDCVPSDTPTSSAVVFFKGPFSGYLRLSLNRDLARQLSCSILGEERGQNAALQDDTLGEIANIICGNALPAIFGFETIFHLEAPSIGSGNSLTGSEDRFSQAAQARLSFDKGVAEVKLFAEIKALRDLPQ